MLTKLAVTALTLLLIWAVFFRRPKPRRRGPGSDKELPHPMHLARCPGCGVYRLPDSPCDCTRQRDGG